MDWLWIVKRRSDTNITYVSELTNLLLQNLLPCKLTTLRCNGPVANDEDKL
jgi:hypothetical protein